MHLLPGLVFTLTTLTTVLLAAPAAPADPAVSSLASPYKSPSKSEATKLHTANRLDIRANLDPPCTTLPKASATNITCSTTMDSPNVSELQGAWQLLKGATKAASFCTNFRPGNCSMVAEFTIPSFDGAHVNLCGDAYKMLCGEVADAVRQVQVKCEWNYRAQGTVSWAGGKKRVSIY